MERWHDIPGYEGVYQASSLGQIRRIKAVSNAPAGHIMKQSRHKKSGYMHLGLTNNRVTVQWYTHQLILMSFVERPDDTEVNHINGTRHDNRLENLEWLTRSENGIHSFAELGRQAARGEASGNAKLTETKVLEIRELLKQGLPASTIAPRYGVHHRTIGSIKTGRTWKHVA